MRHHVFVGERRSRLAIARRVTWDDGCLAARPLFEALDVCGIAQDERTFLNLYRDPRPCERTRSGGLMVSPQALDAIRHKAAAGCVIVAMGAIVSDELARRGVRHVPIVHPAARGSIRLRERYLAHVWERIAGGPWQIGMRIVNAVASGRGASLAYPIMVRP